MATIDDINAQKQSAIDILDQQIYNAISAKNNGAANMDPTIHHLMVQRQAVYVQTYVGASGSADLAAALGTLQNATAQMNGVAAQMTTATTIISNAAALISAAGKVVSGLGG